MESVLRKPFIHQNGDRLHTRTFIHHQRHGASTFDGDHCTRRVMQNAVRHRTQRRRTRDGLNRRTQNDHIRLFGILQNHLSRITRDLEMSLHFGHLIQHPIQTFEGRIGASFRIIRSTDVKRGNTFGMESQSRPHGQVRMRTASHRDQNLLRFAGNFSSHQCHITGRA